MSETIPRFDYDPSLQEYVVNAEAFLSTHREYDVLCTGIAIFDQQGKLLLVQRAAEEHAFPNAWEVPGGKVDDTDETLLHAAVRELKEETGLVATRVKRKVAQFTFGDDKPGARKTTWLKLIFEMEVRDLDVELDPKEHQRYLFAYFSTKQDSQVGSISDAEGGMRFMRPAKVAIRQALALRSRMTKTILDADDWTGITCPCS